MKKYWQIVNIAWQNGFVYRASVFLWRFRQFISSLMALTIWSVIYSGRQELLGYNQESMILYIFIAAIIQSVVFPTALYNLSSQIYSGEVSSLLLKPVNFFGYLISQEFADKLKNFLFVLIEVYALWLIFQPQIFLPKMGVAFFFLVSVLIATGINFCITLLFAAIGFWSPDTWGPRFIFMTLVDFTAGKLFPLDILPQSLAKIVYLTPFPYLAFWPTQIFLGRVEPNVNQLLSSLFWLIGLILLNYAIWRRGWKSYQAAGQ